MNIWLLYFSLLFFMPEIFHTGNYKGKKKQKEREGGKKNTNIVL